MLGSRCKQAEWGSRACENEVEAERWRGGEAERGCRWEGREQGAGRREGDSCSSDVVRVKEGAAYRPRAATGDK